MGKDVVRGWWREWARKETDAMVKEGQWREEGMGAHAESETGGRWRCGEGRTTERRDLERAQHPRREGGGVVVKGGWRRGGTGSARGIWDGREATLW